MGACTHLRVECGTILNECVQSSHRLPSPAAFTQLVEGSVAQEEVARVGARATLKEDTARVAEERAARALDRVVQRRPAIGILIFDRRRRSQKEACSRRIAHGEVEGRRQPPIGPGRHGSPTLKEELDELSVATAAREMKG